jgi:hypothetical protein
MIMRRFNINKIGVVVLAAGVVAGVGGCSTETGPDSHTDVFQTAGEAAAARRAKLRRDWLELASRIANAERPDVKTRMVDPFSLVLSADGVEQTVDLTPISEKLAYANGKEREPIRAFMAERWTEFDRARLKAIGFERARGMLVPYLANMKQTEEMTSKAGGRAPVTNVVVIDLNWVPVVRWPGTGAQTPVEQEVATAWNVPGKQVSDAALANLRQAFATNGDKAVFETTELPGQGRYGSLRSGTDASVILLPAFLASVRRAWKTTDDLVLFVPSRNSVNMIERRNERLLNMMIPQWSNRVGQLSDPLIGQMILDGDSGLSLLSYVPPSAATKPATKPATTNRVYIVH